MYEVVVLARALKHGLTEEQILQAWRNHIGSVLWIDRSDGRVDCKTVGFSDSGIAIELVARCTETGFTIYHAMTPPTKRMIKELRLRRARHDSRDE